MKTNITTDLGEDHAPSLDESIRKIIAQCTESLGGKPADERGAAVVDSTCRPLFPARRSASPKQEEDTTWGTYYLQPPRPPPGCLDPLARFLREYAGDTALLAGPPARYDYFNDSVVVQVLTCTGSSVFYRFAKNQATHTALVNESMMPGRCAPVRTVNWLSVSRRLAEQLCQDYQHGARAQRFQGAR